MYRVGADNLALVAGGVNIINVTTTGATVAGTFSPTGNILAPDGTVSLPSHSFTSDPDSGMYRIGANNLGVAVNATKILDVSTAGLNVIGTVSSNGSPFSPLSQSAGIINGTIAESHAGNAVTFAVKTFAGSDPSAGDPVFFVFRSATAATGTYSVVQATAALSLTISSGSTLGTAPASTTAPFNVWLSVFNDGGTLRVAAIQCLSGSNLYPLQGQGIASATSEGGAGAADSAQVFYANATVTSKAFVTLACATYASLATAGAWDTSPAKLQLFGYGVPLPGTLIQPRRTSTGAVATGSTAVPQDDTPPLSGEGDEYITLAITPTSSASLLKIRANLILATNTANILTTALFQDAGGTSVAAASSNGSNTGVPSENALNYAMVAGTASSTTFKVRAGQASGTITFNGTGGVRLYGGVFNSWMEIDEIQT